MDIQITRQQHEDISAFYDLVKSDSGVIEGFFLKPDGRKSVEYFSDKQAFIHSVTAYNHHGFTCYAGIQPRKETLLQSDRSANSADVTALRILAIDLDACKPRDEAGSKRKVNASDSEKQACLTAARSISASLTNGNMGYQQPIFMDSGSGCWLFMTIPEIAINENNRREITIRIKTWGRRFKELFQQAGVEIDESVFELHRLTKIPGTKVFTYPDEPERPQRISAFLSDKAPRLDEKLRQDFLTMPVEFPEERKVTASHVGGSYNSPDRIFERCYLMKFLADKGASGVSMPHNVRLALSTFSLALGDLENNLSFIRQIIGSCPDFSEAKTRRYLGLNKEKAQPYGCDALRALAKQHFKDFNSEQCQCHLPPTHDQAGKARIASPIRFAGILPEDLAGLFSSLELSGDSYQDFLKVKRFSEEALTEVDAVTAKTYLESVRGELKMSKQAVTDLLKARKAATPSEDATQAQRLIELAKGAELFCTANDQIFATVTVKDHQETWPIKGNGFRNWLKHRFYLETGRPPSSQPLQDALGVIEAKGLFESPERLVFIRVASLEDTIYIDLANDRWESIEITSAGWNVTQQKDVRFRRTRGMKALPYPVKGHSLVLLKKYLNLSNPDDWILIVGWLLSVLKPTGPYPVLTLNGEQGSAKSTLCRIIKSLVDPSFSPLRTTPTDVRDFMIGATNNWILAFDNLSHLPAWASDAICRLSTGGGFSTRELYSDDQEIIFNAMRGILLNGIEDFVTRHDLADRSIVVSLKPIPENQRIAEKDLWRDFEEDVPGILGALCEAVSCALRNYQTVKIDRLPRMADFALWVIAAEEALPWPEGSFMKVYSRNLKDVVEVSLDADLIATAVRSYIQDHSEGYEGTPATLLQILSDRSDDKVTKSKEWPKGAHILTQRLKRAATSLRTFGIEIETGIRLADKTRGIRIIKNTAASPNQSGESSPGTSAIVRSENELYKDVSKSGDASTLPDASFPLFSQPQHPVDSKLTGNAGDALFTSYSRNGDNFLVTEI